MLIRTRRGWESPGLEPTPEEVYYDRRRFLKRAGSFLAVTTLCPRLSADQTSGNQQKSEPPAESDKDSEGVERKGASKKGTSVADLYPAKRNPEFKPGRPLTPEHFATSYNNFYEFSFDKRLVSHYAQRLMPSPWKLEIKGLVEKPQTFDVDDLVRKFPLEERVYRFRCVEAWAMTVPWTGFVLRRLLEHARPLSSAKFIRFETFERPEWGLGFQYQEYPWPYHEALTMAEAANELTLMVTGLYGKPLPKQNGAPVRLIIPWKYGFKSIKSVVSIELTEKKPATFWNTSVPDEYGFTANVDPSVPHPRWSQATERLIDTGERVPTQIYNGYGHYVAGLYGKR